MLLMGLGRSDPINHLTFAPDGRMLVAAGNRGLYLWRHIGDGQRAERLLDVSYLRNPRFTADGRWLFAQTYELWRIELATVTATSLQRLGAYTLSPDGRFLFVSETIYGGTHRNRMTCFRVEDFSAAGRVWERDTPRMSHNLHFLTEGNRLVRFEAIPNALEAAIKYHLFTYDAATGAELTQSRAVNPLYQPHISPDGRWLAERDQIWIHLRSIDAPDSETPSLRNDNRKHFTDLAFHPSGKYLAVTSNDETVKLYDTTTWEVARTFTWDIGKMRSIAFSPDGTLAVAGSYTGKVIVWDVDL